MSLHQQAVGDVACGNDLLKLYHFVSDNMPGLRHGGAR